MPAGDEVLCAVRDVDSGAQIVRVGAALASALSLRLVVVHARQPLPGSRSAAEDPPEIAHRLRTLTGAGDAVVRVHDGAPLAVLQGLGRALGSAWMVVGDGRAAKPPEAPLGETARRLLDARGCPLLVVSTRAQAESRGPVACVVDGQGSTGGRALASLLAQALETSVIAVDGVRANDPAGRTRAAATLALLDAASEVLVIRESALDRRGRSVGSLA